MERLMLIKQIYERLSRLESYRTEMKDFNEITDITDVELKELRFKLQEIMNCPLVAERVK